MEQQAQCMYTGKMISISQLFSNVIDIEHTIPSILPDNTMANKTVCFKRYNKMLKMIVFLRVSNFNKDNGGFTRIDKDYLNGKKER